MRRLYTLLIYLLAPFAFALVLWRGLRDRSYWLALSERFGWGPVLNGSPTIWLHAVSLGEMSAAAALVRALRGRYPQIPMVVTTATPTGRARARALFGDTVSIRFLPYDMPDSVARFFERIRPRLAIILETELWPNLFHECARRGVPLVLVSARLSAKSAARYRRFGRLFSGVFSPNVLIAAQTAEDAERFEAIGADGALIHVVGNVKFDLKLGADIREQGRELRTRHWGARPVWIAGSTHAGEEELVLAAHTELASGGKNPLLLLVPRHPDRFDEVAGLLARRGFRFERRSGRSAIRADTQVVLVDTVGELVPLYASVDVAFVGGSLLPIGGHNLLEPAALGVPVVTGPYNTNSKNIAELLLQHGAALQVHDSSELGRALRKLLADPAERQRMGAAALRVVESNRGSVERVLELIEPLMRSFSTGESAGPSRGTRPGSRPPD